VLTGLEPLPLKWLPRKDVVLTFGIEVWRLPSSPSFSYLSIDRPPGPEPATR